MSLHEVDQWTAVEISGTCCRDRRKSWLYPANRWSDPTDPVHDVGSVITRTERTFDAGIQPVQSGRRRPNLPAQNIKRLVTSLCTAQPPWV
jgi:hypothetical protein